MMGDKESDSALSSNCSHGNQERGSNDFSCAVALDFEVHATPPVGSGEGRVEGDVRVCGGRMWRGMCGGGCRGDLRNQVSCLLRCPLIRVLIRGLPQ